MPTKKEFLTEQYINFINEIKTIIDIDIFPSLDDVDITDVLLFFQMSFTDENDYESIVKNIMDMSGIDIPDEQFNKAMPIITKYISELKNNLKKSLIVFLLSILLL